MVWIKIILIYDTCSAAFDTLFGIVVVINFVYERLCVFG